MLLGNRNEDVGEIVARYFICGLGAMDAIPVAYDRRTTRVHVHWSDGSRWNVLCTPDFVGEYLVKPSARDKIRHYRLSLVQGAKPVIARIRNDRVMLSGKEGFPLSAFDLPSAA